MFIHAITLTLITLVPFGYIIFFENSIPEIIKSLIDPSNHFIFLVLLPIIGSVYAVFWAVRKTTEILNSDGNQIAKGWEWRHANSRIHAASLREVVEIKFHTPWYKAKYYCAIHQWYKAFGFGAFLIPLLTIFGSLAYMDWILKKRTDSGIGEMMTIFVLNLFIYLFLLWIAHVVWLWKIAFRFSKE